MHQFYSIKRFLKHKLSFEIVTLARRKYLNTSILYKGFQKGFV